MKANGLVKGTQSIEHPFYLSKNNKQDECRMVFHHPSISMAADHPSLRAFSMVRVMSD